MTSRPTDLQSGRPADQSPPDAFLVSGVVGGDSSALRVLIRRYDRLIRYTVYRMAPRACVRDPQWLDATASATWYGFVRSLRRNHDSPPRSLSAYLIQIARNQTADALRQLPEPASGSDTSDTGQNPLPEESAHDDLADSLGRLEELSALKECIDALEADDRLMFTQLSAILDRRWRDAAQALGWQESTLRSRWQRTLEKLRIHLRRKESDSLAPRAIPGDY